jgi:hypothetical protein
MQSAAEALFLICEMNRGLVGYNGIKDERTIIYMKAENMSVRSRKWVCIFQIERIMLANNAGSRLRIDIPPRLCTRGVL